MACWRHVGTPEEVFLKPGTCSGQRRREANRFTGKVSVGDGDRYHVPIDGGAEVAAKGAAWPRAGAGGHPDVRLSTFGWIRHRTGLTAG